MSEFYASDGTRLHEVTLTATLLVREGEQEQMARDIRRVLASRKALKRLLLSIATIAVQGPGMISRVPVMPDGEGVQQPPSMSPLRSVGWLGGANDRPVIDEAAPKASDHATHNDSGQEDSSITPVRPRRSHPPVPPAVTDYHVHGCPSHGAPFRCTVRHRAGMILLRRQVVELCPHPHRRRYA